MDPTYFMIPFFDDLAGIQPAPQQRPSSSSWARRNQLSRMDDKIFDMGNQLADFQTALDRTLARLGMGGLGSLGGGDRPTNWMGLLCPSVESKIESGTEEQSGKYTVNVPLGANIAPEDLKVSLKEHVMTIEAKKEQKSEDGTSRVYQEFTKKFTLPPNVNMKEVKTVLTPEGYLKIEAPLPQEALPEPPLKKAAMEIPIHQG